MSNFPKPKHWPQRRDFEANVWPQSRDFQANAITEFNRIFSSSRSHIFNLLFCCGINFFLNISFWPQSRDFEANVWPQSRDFQANAITEFNRIFFLLEVIFSIYFSFVELIFF